MNFFHTKSSRIFFRKAAVSLLTAVFVLEPIMALAVEGDAPIMLPPTVEGSSEVPSIEPILESLSPSADIPSIASPEVIDEPDPGIESEAPLFDQGQEKKLEPDGEMSMLVGDGSDPYYPGFRTDTSVKNPLSTPKVDESSGAMILDYKIPTPSGRNGVEPDLSLHYSSLDRSITENILGLGWNLSIPYIERFATSGTQDLYSKFGFRSSLSGELVALSANTYAARTERGDFLNYQLANGAWIVKDKKGLTYTFGNVSTTQLLDSTSSTKIFKWMLTEIRDLNGNYATYSYEKDQGQVYPDQITYTHATGTSGIFTVDFDREARPITNFTYRPGFLVKTAYRISVIRISVSGFERYRATLGYNTGDNTTNSRLATITERYTAPDGTQLTRSPIGFGYDKNISQYVTPTILPGAGDGVGMQVGEVDGDGLPDVVRSRIFYNPTTGLETPQRKVYLGSGYAVSSTWNIPAGLEFTHTINYGDRGVRFVDMNGDGLTDFLGEDKVWYNGLSHPTTPTSSWYDTGINVPVELTIYSTWNQYEPNGTFLVDLNKDGMTDLLRKDIAYLYTGSGFISSTSWTLPMPLHSYSRDRVLRQAHFTDLNGDGLTDLISTSGTHLLYDDNFGDIPNGVGTTTQRFFFNTGTGWQENASTTLPGFAINGQFFKNAAAQEFDVVINSARFVDLNGDGLQDYIRQEDSMKIDHTCGRQYSSPYYYNYKHYLNTGNGFVTSTGAPPELHTIHTVTQGGTCVVKKNYYNDLGTNVLDLTGDTVVDKANFNLTISGTQFASNADIGSHDTLTKIIHPEGATTTILYAGARQQFSTPGNPDSTHYNKQLPVSQRVVESIETDDNNGTVTSTKYSYEEGSLYNDRSRPHDIAFAGFGKVKVTSPGNIRTIYFHQGNTSTASNGEYADSYGRLGLPYKIEVSDRSGNIYSTELMKYDETSLPSAYGEAPRAYVSLARKVVQSYDGGTAHRDIAETYAYDVAGNLIDAFQYGEVTSTTPNSFTDILGDSRRTIYEYALLPGGASSTLVSRKLESGFGTSTRETKYSYDDQLVGSALYGHQTQVLIADASSTLRISTSSTYSALGLPLSEIDARGNTTTFEYDSAHLYVGTTTNPLGHYATSTFDYFFGEPTRIFDENGQVKRMVYDPSGRQKEFYGPDAEGAEVKLWDVEYTDTKNAVKTLKNTYYSATSTTDIVYSYFDGYGRQVLTKRSNYDSQWLSQWKRFDGDGREFKTTVPIASGTSVSSTYPTNNNFSIYQYYDAQGRLKTLTTSVGTTQYSHALWTETITDALGKVKKIKRDAYGRISEIIERNNSIDYSTRYTYDHFGNLLSITDASGKIRNFSYDALGRRTKAEDVHSVSDSSFLTIQYGYDANGNITTEHRNDQTSLGATYDSLNRPLTHEQNTSTVYTLAYDSCLQGIGKLCQESSANYSKQYTYDSAGNIKSTDFVYGSTTYSELTARDFQGRVTSSTLPDGSSLGYVYHGWKLQSLNAKEVGAASTTPIITDIGYDADQLPSVTAYGNGAITYSDRDPQKLWRTTAFRTRFDPPDLPAGPYFQELEYSYDANNRIVGMRELDATSTKRRVQYVYDDLHRLTSAVATTTGYAPLYKETYGYDPVGNILWTNLTDPTGTSTTSTYSYGAPLNTNTHAVTAVSSTRNNVYQGYTGIEYDTRGNVATTTWYNASGTENIDLRHVNTYDPANQMIATDLGSATRTLLYLYDKDGIRITQKFATSTVVYSSPTYNATIDESGVRIDAEKHFGDGLRTLVTVDGSGLGARYLYQHQDHLGSANTITTGARTFEQVLDYMPFGGVRVDSKAGAWSEQRQYAGHDFDQTSGYSYMKARYYDPLVKRFFGQDKMFWSGGYDLSDPQMANSYSYSRNTPITHVDPDGKLPILAVGLVWIAASGIAVSTPLFGAGVYSLHTGDQHTADQMFAAQQFSLATTQAGVAIAIDMAPLAVAYGASKGLDWATGQNSLMSAESSVKNINISQSKYPEAAQHISDAQKKGHPSVLTIDRTKAAENRSQSMRGMTPVPGKQLDEYPPAMFREGGAGASVRPISPRDNMGAGACMGNQCRGLSDGSRVKIKVTP